MDGFKSVRNYYESLVYQEIYQCFWNLHLNEDQMADIACIALNSLPPKYIRHEVDMTFYIDDQAREKQKDQIEHAVKSAYIQLFGNAVAI